MTIPLVLVHGWAGSAESWLPVIGRLDRERWDPVIAVRLPGSPGYPGSAPARITPAAIEVGELLRELSAPAVVVGHSMGAQISLLAHTLAPESTLAEVVIDPAYGAPETERTVMARWAARIAAHGPDELTHFFREAIRGLDDETADDVLADLARTPVDTVASYLRSEYVDSDAIGLLPATRMAAARRTRPVLAIHSNPSAAALERTLPSPACSRVIEWERSHHFLHLQYPDRFVALLDSWGSVAARHGDIASAAIQDEGFL